MMKLTARNAILDLTFPQVMGILNVTPDSFSDGGQYSQLNSAINRVNQMVNAGASIIDIGGESTRPGAEEVSVEAELARVIPLVEVVASRFETWVSVDTSKPEVMLAAAEAGAHLINDVRALTLPGALEAAAATQLPICLMHMQGWPASMQHSPSYGQLLAEIEQFFFERINQCHNADIKKQNILIDPGFGFGKTVQHNYQLLANLAYFQRLELPILVGMSRKSMIGQLLNVGPNDRLTGSLACAVVAAMQGANIIRVHDVKETVEALRIVEAVNRAKGI